MSGKEKQKVGGLAGIIAGDSAICLCSAEEESLLYRGYPIQEIANHALFEEAAWLLLRGSPPSRQEMQAYQQKLKRLRTLPEPLKQVLEILPKEANPMDVMRTGCSFLGHLEPEQAGRDSFEVADRLIACFGSILLYWHHFHHSKTRLNLNTDEETLAGHILQLIRQKPIEEEERQALNGSLILYAEHEFNASTFTVRTIASTLSDFYSAICGGIGALRGPLHGGANELALKLIQQFKTPDEAEKGILDQLKEKKLIMGFGHRVYTTSDPRSPLIKEWARKLAHNKEQKTLFSIAERIEEVMWNEKKLFPNLDFYSALAYHFLDIPLTFFTPLFVMSRISGWSAHLLEQRAHNKLIRPLSHYIGPEAKKWIPLANR